MKCTPIKLESRSELRKNKLDGYIKKVTEPAYVTKEGSRYSFTFNKYTSSSKIAPNIKVKDLKLPDDFTSYNSGYSLEKWSKKRPRLKSTKKNSKSAENCDFQEDDDTCDIDIILNTLETSNEVIKEETEYEINSDIEELFRRSQEYDKSETQEERKERHRSSKRKLKRRLKTIKYSFSKPASPLTEQIIRVDVTSNIPIDELRQLSTNRDELRKEHQEHECDNRDFDGKFRLDTEEQECIIRCSQLALTPKIS